MKFLILLLVMFIRDVTCNDSILSKFHQNSYKIREFRATLNSYNEEYFNFVELKTFKYNRTTTALNGTINTKIELYDKVEVLVQAYKFLSNEYRRIAIRFQVNLRKAVDSDVIGIKQVISKCGNITDAFFKAGVTYHACNFVLDETHLPPLIPSGRYKVNVIYLYLNQEIVHTSGFAEVYTPIAYPKD